MSSHTERTPQQPIHPSVIPRLDPEYLEFHNKDLLYQVPPHTLPWDPSIRNGPTVPGSSAPLKIGKTQEYELPKTKFRALTPEGTPPAGGWPAIVYFHGGGWTLGGLEAEFAFQTNMCVRAKCVVVNVDYRLAPENPYPAAVDDTVDALLWVIKNGERELGINLTKVAVGGCSSGGNLATILALKAVESQLPINIIFQLLIVPVTDNTASVETSWAENELTPWLSPGRMLWFRRNYLPNEEDWAKWDSSPLFAPDNLIAKLPKAWISVCELDILRDEGIQYGEKMRKAGVEVEIEVYKGAPHPIMAMDGALTIGRKLVDDAVAALKAAFN
ncbi:hypothetical protein GALMADRAFT_162062 [Galerina marginata CBS 339.88]|uniref:Alpha/beta hydrolase fold-3 domain-containing protein n=1 Tax=Galerina marginata (strain CBS 339.88) TaxID=685588 RepID=A0A067S6Q7_GALM3|nr:hypothetical protein GALMADRAFT_162062 [Galerina marginata CBS 339.88]